MASIAPKFGPPEYLWLIAFSITIVVAISSGSLVKGLIILGAFLIHDLTPGPRLLAQNIDVVYADFLGIMLSSLVLFFAGNRR